MSSESRVALVVLLLAATAYGAASGRARVAAQDEGAGRTAAEGRESLAVIVNRANPVENLSFAELRHYFLGERTHWPNGRRVALVMRGAAHDERDAVLRLIYEMREQDFRAHFLRARFTGETLDEPHLLDTTSRVANFVFLQPGAVGCVRAAELPPSAKVVRIDGRLPGDAGYRLTY